MPRADLHTALVIDREIYDASQVDPALLDPVVRPEGALPGVVRPFAVVRAYQGPQGIYAEQFTIADRKGRVVYRSPVRPVELRGEMFEDTVVDTLTGVQFDAPAEHVATFSVDDEEVASIPVFVESGRGGDPRVAAEETFKQALKKGTILWLRVPQPPAPSRRGRNHVGKVDDTRPIWFVYDGGKVYVLTGEGEQQIPGLTGADEVTIIARSKDHRSLVSAIPADVRVIPTDDDEWEQRAKAALPKRLNLPDGQRALERWRATCTLVELTPRFREAADDEAAADAGGPVVAAAGSAAPGAGTPSAAPAAEAGDEIHVEAQIDQEVYDQLIAEGKSERLARAKAKAAFVRREKARIRAERETAAAG